MSQNNLTTQLIKVVSTNVDKFIVKVSKKYNISETELSAMWTGDKNTKENHTKNHTEDKTSSASLMKLKKSELVEMCKSKKFKTTGTKQVLVDRLLGNETKKASPEVKKQTVLTKIKTTKALKIKKNKFGNHVHVETNLVIDTKSKKAIGTQKDDGKIASLTDKDIENCKKFKIKFDIPQTIEEEVIEEEDEEVIEEEDEDEVIEEEDEEEVIEEEDEEEEDEN